MDEPATERTVRADRRLVSLHHADVRPAAFVPRAIEYFLRQDYAHKQLVIVDDGREASRISCHGTIGSCTCAAISAHLWE